MTQTQFQAADPATSVWLAAHAGTGKTKVLVDRVLRLLLAGAEISSILCLTYTKAAAMEMQLRIRNVLLGWMRMDDATLANALHALLGRAATTDESAQARRLLCQMIDHPQGLHIQTIHAFCQSLLSRFPLEAGISPHFAVMEESEASRLLHESIERLLWLMVDPRDTESVSRALADVASQVADSTLKDVLKAIVADHALFFSLLAPEQGREQLISRIYRSLGVAPDSPADAPLHELSARLAPHADALREAAKAMKNSPIAESVLVWCAEPNEEHLSNLIEACLTQQGELRAISKFSLKDQPEHTATMQHLYESVSDCLEAQRAQAVAQYSASLVWLADALLSIYRTLKQQRFLLDYDDLILGVVTLLSQEGISGWVMTRLGYHIQHILIDEAQDTAPAQWQLTDRLLTDLFQPDTMAQQRRTLFVVGDAKQSIYRFQGADPALFAHKQHEYREWFAATQQPFCELTLDTSFRSTAAVLEAVDALCRLPALAPAIGDFAQGHRPHRSEDAGKVELWPLTCVAKPKPPLAWEVREPAYAQPDATQQMAQQIATTIRNWLDEGRQLPAKGRAVKPGDIMILVRRRGALVNALSRQLQQLSIPVAGADRIMLAQHLAVQDVLAIASWCLLPEDDLSLATILKGPLFGMDEASLFALAHPRGERDLWEWMQAGNGDAKHIATLQALLEASRYMPIYRFLIYVLEQQGLRRALKSRMGSEADDVCNELLHQALQMQEQGLTLQPFVAAMQQSESQIKRDFEQGIDAVRILTAHGAKGLQAPIVLLPDTTRKPDTKDKIWWGEEGGHHVCYAIPSGVKAPAKVVAIRKQMQDSDAQEYLRLLYVALTRAEDELYVMGATHHQKAQEGSWYALVDSALRAHAKTNVQQVDGGELLQLISPQLRAVASHADEAKANLSALPEWVLQSPLIEKAQLTLRATQAAAIESPAMLCGTLIHRLLQWMPQPDEAFDEATLHRLAVSWADSAVAHEAKTVAQEVWRIRSDASLSWLFGLHSRAELALSARLPSGRLISGQIDRLVLHEGSVHIIDFKSGRDVPPDATHTPESYRRQLADYAWLVGRLYPSMPLRCYLLWTATATLMEVNNELLENASLHLDSEAA